MNHHQEPDPKSTRSASVATYSRKAQATRAALLEAARLVIAKDGYRGARIVDIAERSGKSVGVFYTYFTDKNDLFGALVEEFYSDLARLTPPVPAYEEDLAGAVRAAVGAFWNSYRDFHPELVGLMEAALTDPVLLATWQKIRQRGTRPFEFRIRRQQEQGRCSGLEPKLAASALHGMLEFTCFNWHSRKLDFPGDGPSDDEAIDTLYGLIARVLEIDPALAAGQPGAPEERPA